MEHLKNLLDIHGNEINIIIQIIYIIFIIFHKSPYFYIFVEHPQKHVTYINDPINTIINNN